MRRVRLLQIIPATGWRTLRIDGKGKASFEDVAVFALVENEDGCRWVQAMQPEELDPNEISEVDETLFLVGPNSDEETIAAARALHEAEEKEK